MSMRLKNPALLIALATVYPVIGYAAGAARIDFVAGDAIVVSGATQRPLTKGAEISSGDTIRTGENGRVQLRFTDGALVSLQPKSEFRVDDYNYGGKNDGQEKGFFALLRGGLRTITGAIGKGNADRYRVTTNVATIGIRGTEYAVSYAETGNRLLVHTGEGRIEVCNTAGCIFVSGGESANVNGANAAPTRTTERPVLPPAQPNDGLVVVTALGENRTPSGGIPPVSNPMLSGTYAVTHTGIVSGSPNTPAVASSTNVSFDPYSVATSFGTNQALSVTGGFSDGILAWGKWGSGSDGANPLGEYHYVVGNLTPASDIAALTSGNATLNYKLIGATLPTAGNGATTTIPTATMSAQFYGGMYVAINLDLKMSVGGQSLTRNLSGSGLPAANTFSYMTACDSVAGFFAGSNASRAGVSYKIDCSSVCGTTVSGALAFTR